MILGRGPSISTTERWGQPIGTLISLEFGFVSLHGSTGRHQDLILHKFPHTDLEILGGGRWNV